MDSKVERWSVGWPKGWRACCEAGPGKGHSRCKVLRELSVSEAQNRGCPFRLTQKMDTVGRRCHGVHLPGHLRENAEFIFPTCLSWDHGEAGIRACCTAAVNPASDIRPREMRIPARSFTGSQLP